MIMPKYRKKPVVIEAMEVTRDGWTDIISWAHKDRPPLANSICFPADGGLLIRTLEGDMHARIGDFVIKGVKGEFYPCKPDIFAATYEPA